MIDACAGLGGASEPMMDHPNWDVIRIDNSHLVSHVENMVILDLMDTDFITTLKNMVIPGKYDFIFMWFSPTCTEFSLARVPRIENPCMKLVQRCLEIQKAINPDAWLIENVKGAQKHFRPILGAKRMNLESFYFWGNFPLFHADISGHSKFENDSWSDDPLRPMKRAYVPAPIGEALIEAIMNQRTLFSF